jgi:hypothetical protein
MESTRGHAPVDMLARAARLADEHSSAVVDPGELLSAAGDLVEWGLLTEARRLVARLAAGGHHPREVARLLRIMDFVNQKGPEFEPAFLSTAIATATDPNATREQLSTAADSLLKWGALDEADAAIARLERLPGGMRVAGSMKAASRQLRRSGILSDFSAVGSTETAPLNRPHEAILARGDADADKLIVAFTGADRKFWLSLHVLYHFLKRFGAHVLYLHDHSGAMFMNGLLTVAPGYPAMVDLIRDRVRDLGVRQTYVMAFSAGGYVGLRAAADIRADGYLGFGIRTDMSPATPLPMSKYVRGVIDRSTDKTMLVNLRPYLERVAYPRSIRLISAEGAKHDVAHAENLRGLDRLTIAYLKDYDHHNVMPGLIARGLLERVLSQFLGPARTNAGA